MNLIIDDVAAALALATNLGQTVLSRPANDIRAAVLQYAARHGWMVVPHSDYVRWARSRLDARIQKWVVLDPLFPGGAISKTLGLRPTRLADPSRGVRFVGLNGGVSELCDPGDVVGVIDDAAASGTTLRHVQSVLADAGASLGAVLVCASSKLARETICRAEPQLKWVDFVPGEWAVIHLRDGCPNLPFSGRPTGDPPVIGLDGKPIEVCVPATSFMGNLWRLLWRDPTVQQVISNARLDVARRLSRHLGEAALVRHLALLGPSIPLLTLSNTAVQPDAELEAVQMSCS